jgi:hypothetical protein
MAARWSSSVERRTSSATVSRRGTGAAALRSLMLLTESRPLGQVFLRQASRAPIVAQ